MPLGADVLTVLDCIPGDLDIRVELYGRQPLRAKSVLSSITPFIGFRYPMDLTSSQASQLAVSDLANDTCTNYRHMNNVVTSAFIQIRRAAGSGLYM